MSLPPANNSNIRSRLENLSALREIKFLPVFILFLVLGFGAYAPVIFYPFVHDDVVFIQQNPHIAAVSNLGQMFHWEKPAMALTNPYWRPVLEFFYRIQYQLFGFNPQGYHFFNILLHVVNSSLIFYCLNILLRRPVMALAVGLVFLLHPVQSEAVACVSGISNLLFTLFCLLSFVFYRRSLFISLGFYALALFSKEQAIVLPLVIIFYGYLFGEEKRKGIRLEGPAGWFILVSILYLLLRKIFLGSSLVSLWAYPHELILRLLAIPRALLMYFQVLLWPQGLHYYRSIDILSPWQGTAAGLMTVMVGLIVLILSSPRSVRRLFLFGLGWFFITLLPMLNILPIIHEYSYIAAFEHFLYLPMAGFFLGIFLIAEYLITVFLKSCNRKVMIIAGGILGLLYFCLTQAQVQYWRGEIPLFERVLRYEPGLGRVHLLLGKAYYFNKEYDRSIAEFTAAKEIMQTYLNKVKDPIARVVYLGFLQDLYFNAAHAFEAKGQWTDALKEYEQVLSIMPEAPVAETHNNIGNVYIQMGDLQNAKDHFLQAVEIDSRHLMAMSNLAVCYIKENNFEEAEKLLTQALVIDGQFGPARQNLEQLLLQKKQRDTTIIKN